MPRPMVCVRRLGMLLLFLVLGALPLSAATLLFSNLVQPGGQYGPDGVSMGHTPAFQNSGDYLIYAVPFVPSTTAYLTDIQVPWQVISGPNQISAWVLNDSGGTPGSILTTDSMAGGPAGGTALIDLPFTLDPLLNVGQRYWFAAAGGPDTFAYWTLTLFQGNSMDGGASQLVTGGIKGPWIAGTGTRTGALQVFGEPIPEPASLLLVASCLALMILAVKRRIGGHRS